LKEFLKIKEVAQILNVSQSHVYHLIATHRLPAISIGGAKRILRADLYQWIEQQAAREA
jgi:excisionase family DNA binding protein